MSHRISVVILNWNTRNFLEKFLPDVIRYSEDLADVIVADNASTDDTVDFLIKNFPSVKIIRNANNDGYAGGYNSALSKVETEYYILLNSDVKVTEHWLEPMLTLMDSDKQSGACQPKILSYHSPEYFEYAGAAGGFIDKYGYPFCRGRIFNTVEKDNHQYDDNCEIFWATGACMMIRSAVFKSMGGFDALFFAHMEEIDLCWRIRNTGKKILYCAESKVFHVGGGTLPKSNPHKTYLNFRNNLLMVYKNASESDYQSILKTRIFLDILAAFKFLFSGNFKDYKAVLKAWRDFKKLKSSYSRPISKIIENKNPTSFFIFPKSILRYYYLYGRKKFSSLGWNNNGNR